MKINSTFTRTLPSLIIPCLLLCQCGQEEKEGSKSEVSPEPAAELQAGAPAVEAPAICEGAAESVVEPEPANEPIAEPVAEPVAEPALEPTTTQSEAEAAAAAVAMIAAGPNSSLYDSAFKKVGKKDDEEKDDAPEVKEWSFFYVRDERGTLIRMAVWVTRCALLVLNLY